MTWPGAGIGLEPKYHGPPALPIPWVLHLSLRFLAVFFPSLNPRMPSTSCPSKPSPSAPSQGFPQLL